MTTTTTATKPRSRESEVNAAVAAKDGAIAIVWEPDREPGAPPPMPGYDSVRGYLFSWVDEAATAKRVPNKNGLVPAFKTLELDVPGLNWVSLKLWEEALAESQRRVDVAAVDGRTEKNPLQDRIKSGSIRAYMPKAEIENPKGQLEEYTDADAAELIRAIHDIDILKACLTAYASLSIADLLKARIEEIETEGASRFGG